MHTYMGRRDLTPAFCGEDRNGRIDVIEVSARLLKTLLASDNRASDFIPLAS